MPKAKKRVLIVGTGTIGEPLIDLFADQAKNIGIDEVLFHKRSPLIEEVGKVKALLKTGAKLVVDKDKKEKFLELGLEPSMAWEEALRAADVIIDCTPEGNKLKEKYYKKLSRPKGFIAQGSEEGF